MADNIARPMTRSRAVDGNVPNPLAKTYYVQRASAGLIITEATQVSPQGVGYIRTPCSIISLSLALLRALSRAFVPVPLRCNRRLRGNATGLWTLPRPNFGY
jgi:hypothetical protein